MAGAQGEGAGGGAAAPRSRLWGLGFAALGALGLELERGTELRSQRSHRDERRSRRLGFSQRPAPPAPRPDRWESTGTSGPRPPRRSLCLGGIEHSGVRPERWLPAFQYPCVLVSRKILGGPCTLLRLTSLTWARRPQPLLPVVGRRAGGLTRMGATEGLRRERGCRLQATGCGRVWGCFCADRARVAEAGGSRVARSALSRRARRGRSFLLLKVACV